MINEKKRRKEKESHQPKRTTQRLWMLTLSQKDLPMLNLRTNQRIYVCSIYVFVENISRVYICSILEALYMPSWMISNRISSFILVATYRVADFRVFFLLPSLSSSVFFVLFCFVFLCFFCPLSPNSFLASCLSGLECRRGAISTSLQNGCVTLFFFKLSSRAASLRRHLSFLLHVFKKTTQLPHLTWRCSSAPGNIETHVFN